MYGIGHRRGSALLVVLGMVSFLVISAVAFSAYMRYSRLPSSFLRQTSASRLLVKAALANAIDEIDAAIGNNPHPGVGNAAYAFPRETGPSACRNYWMGRVYTGTNNVSDIEMEDTVTPLGFESLAYIPPAIVNEVRYYSRRALSASWRGLGFNSGRYVFCAVDVSDYFDVNAVDADAPRSSDPGSRISLAHLFEDPTTGAARGFCTVDQWNKVMDDVRSSNVPLISMADWNLAMQQLSPFVKYLGRTQEDGTFYGGENLDNIRNMTFVSDSYFPTAAGEKYDLADSNYQPWKYEDLKTWKADACEAVASGTSKCLMRLADHVPFVVSAALYDYLDVDSVPCSLALPTVECAPMICGIEVTMPGSQLAVKDMIEESQKYQYNPNPYNNSPTRETTKTLQYNLDKDKLQLGNIQVSALVTCPFRHEGSSAQYKVDGALLLFLTSSDMGLRPGSPIDRLKEAMGGSSDGQIFTTASIKNGVISLPISGSVGFSGAVKDQRAAVQPVTLTVTPGSAPNDLDSVNNALFKAVIKCTQTADPIDPQDLTKGYNWDNPKPANADIEENPSTTVDSAECKFQPLAGNGSKDSAYEATGTSLFTTFKNGGAKLKLNVAVVLRVMDPNGKFVDMVPATGWCDTFNRTQNDSGQARECIAAVSGDWGDGGTPLMRLDTGAEFTWGLKGFKDSIQTPAGVSISPRTAFICDPRYNYAPESWYKSDKDCSEQNWLDECGAESADGDIFLQTSDQGWLQSVYEFANLPRVGEVDRDGTLLRGANDFRGQLKEPESITRKSIGSKDEALNHDFMWKTYDPFSRYRSGGDRFESLGLVSDGGGYKINPYSETNILMSAFANTPHDWSCAYVGNQAIGSMDAVSFNKKYAWNEYSSGAKLKWSDLEEVVGQFKSKLSTAELSLDDVDDPLWQDALYEAFNGARDNDRNNFTLCGVDLKLDDMYNTDRKFLYGYWHDCLSMRQQLFLIFVRAEPVMMGGGAIGQTPPQLGARAVALVWRDPTPTEKFGNAVAPHRTRVLFYRQFE